VYNLGKVFNTPFAADAWQTPRGDPYFYSGESLILPLMYPVYTAFQGEEIGTVFLAATTALITDKLSGYHPPKDAPLYVRIRGKHYRIEEGRLEGGGEGETDFSYSQSRPAKDAASSPRTSIEEDRDRGGKNRVLVSYAVDSNIALVQVLNYSRFFDVRSAWPVLASLFAGLIALLLCMALGVSRQTREITGLMEKRIADEKNQRDLEYRMLQSQINPHFLYNTLNSIRWMASIQKAQGIAEMTTALSRLLQKVSRDSRRMVPLGEELTLLDDYLVIQKYRYGDSVSLHKTIEDPRLLDTLIPRFVLQPLAENAIFHGIEPKGGGVITVEIRRRGDDALVSITDDGVGMTGETIASLLCPAPEEAELPARELGLHNVDERLRRAFGEGYGLSIASQEGAFTTMTITLPLHGELPRG
jgi:two-component system sensor histidine kinase YesM